MKLMRSIAVICLALLCGARSHAHSYSAPRAPKPQVVIQWLWMPLGVTNGLTGSNFATNGTNFANSAAYKSLLHGGSENWNFKVSASPSATNFNVGNRFSLTSTLAKAPYFNFSLGGTNYDLATNALCLAYNHTTNIDAYTYELVGHNFNQAYTNLSVGFLYRSDLDGTGGDQTAIDHIMLTGSSGHYGSLNVRPALGGGTNMFIRAETTVGTGNAITNYLPRHLYWGMGMYTNGGSAWQLLDAENGWTNMKCNDGTITSFNSSTAADTCTGVQFFGNIGHGANSYACTSYVFCVVISTNSLWLRP